MSDLAEILSQYKLLDLGHEIDEKIPTWSGDCGFAHEIIHDYPDANLRAQSLKMSASAGTHMDAPSHFFESESHISHFPLALSIVKAAIIDVRDQVSNCETYRITVEDIDAFESNFGKLSGVKMVVFQTGFSCFWDQPTRYRNAKEGMLSLPEIAPEVATYLSQQNVKILGIDTLSPDGGNIDFPVHKIWLKAQRYIVENMNLSFDLPPFLMVGLFPMRIKNGTEAPMRMMGFHLNN